MDGKTPVIASNTEMAYRQTCRRMKNGELIYRYGFLINTVFSMKFLVEDCTEENLPS